MCLHLFSIYYLVVYILLIILALRSSCILNYVKTLQNPEFFVVCIFFVSGMNTEIYKVNLCIQSEYSNRGTGTNSESSHFLQINNLGNITFLSSLSICGFYLDRSVKV